MPTLLGTLRWSYSYFSEISNDNLRGKRKKLSSILSLRFFPKNTHVLNIIKILRKDHPLREHSYRYATLIFKIYAAYNEFKKSYVLVQTVLKIVS